MTKTGKLARQSEITRERVKQIEAKALRRIKGPTLGVVIVE